MRAIILDFHEFHTSREVHGYLAAKLDFPDYYGHNLDALYDMLTEISEDTCITVVCAGQPYEEGFITVFEDAAQGNRHFFLTGCR